MRLFMDKRPFSWDCDYRITYENNKFAYRVKGESGKKKNTLTLYNPNEMALGTVVMKKGLFSPTFELFLDERSIGTITKDFTFAVTRYVLHLSRWRVFGMVMSWEFDIMDEGCLIMHAGTDGSPYAALDQFLLDIYYDNNDIPALLAALGMEAATSTLRPQRRRKPR
ncbi:MAG: hypothetical protein RSC76_01985 [Oscillospiraceae bacterium]